MVSLYPVLGIFVVLINNTDGIWQGAYWGVMNVLGSALVATDGITVAKYCGKRLRK